MLFVHSGKGGFNVVSDIEFKIVTLCGSIRFKDDFIKAQNELTLQGNIVISIE